MTEGAPARRSGELTAVELLRWAWRQLTSMRTALVLLLLVALAAIPGSLIPQRGVDSLKTVRWQEQHPELTPIYERLGLFDVYSSVWFSAIYILLMISLVGCILPRIAVYARAVRAAPPPAPRHLTRLPVHAAYPSSESADAVLARVADDLRSRRYRVVAEPGADSVSAERGYLREAGNLVFHLALLVALAGFAIGGLYGYRGGAIILVGNGFANNLVQYDDYAPGSLFDPDSMEPFCFTIDDFDVDWIPPGQKGAGMSRGFVSHLDYEERCGSGDSTSYDLRVNHPLTIGDTDVFLIGHGYAPVLTVKDADGKVLTSGPAVFLPMDKTLKSMGVVKVQYAEPQQFGLQGLFFPGYVRADPDGDGPEQSELINVTGELVNPTVSMTINVGDLGMESGAPQSIYALDTTNLTMLMKDDGKTPQRVDLQPGMTQQLPDGLGSVTFERVVEWNRLQFARTPGKGLALGGVVVALLGLLGSLYVRPRRVWVRARPADDGSWVEVGVLDRSGGGDPEAVLAELTDTWQAGPDTHREEPDR